jgi:hypothetical protein
MPGKEYPEPDVFLFRRKGVCYRYVLLLRGMEEVGGIFGVLEELGLSLQYFLMLPGPTGSTHVIYLGLDSVDVQDFPVQMAALGIQVERGESIGELAR